MIFGIKNVFLIDFVTNLFDECLSTLKKNVELNRVVIFHKLPVLEFWSSAHSHACVIMRE